MAWKIVKLGNLLVRKRETIKTIPDSEYKLITIKLHHKGIVLREIRKGGTIKSPMSKVSGGDFVLSGIDARNGAFGIVPAELDNALITNDFWCLVPNEKVIKKEFLLFITSTKYFDYICNQSSDGTTQRIRLQREKFFNYEIEIPELDEQNRILKKLKELKYLSDSIESEQSLQLNLVRTLRQQILQDAIQGKLVPQDSNDEPASVLLERISVEKEKLIREKKIKKEKPLPPIRPVEFPFEIPDNWLWCRLGELCTKITDGTHHSPPNVETGDYRYITAKNIKNTGIELNDVTYVSKEVHDQIYTRCNPEYGDILYIKDGATTGIVTVNNLNEPFSMLSSVALLKLPKMMNNKFLMYAMRSPYFYDATRNDMFGVAITRVTLEKIQNSSFALPPLQEQNRIVSKIEQLMTICDELEQTIQQNKKYTQELLQVTLKEALERKN
jgi:type I restriction enzyme S subunit